MFFYHYRIRYRIAQILMKKTNRPEDGFYGNEIN